LAAAGLILLAGWSSLVAAESGTLPRIEAGAGAIVLNRPDYRGSDERRTATFPVPYLVYYGERLRADREGLRGLLFGVEEVSVSVSMLAALPGDRGRNMARQGMPRLLPTFEGGPSLDVRMWRHDTRAVSLTGRMAVRAVMATDARRFETAGFVAHPELRLRARGGWEKWEVDSTWTLGALWADRDYHAYFYGVDPEFETADRAAFSARSGYSGTRMGVSAGFSRDGWRVTVFTLYDRLDGAVFTDSPLMRQRDALVFGVFAGYRFWSTGQGQAER
jgi:MipA family protein